MGVREDALEALRVLDLVETATDEDIRSADRQLVAVWHPDFIGDRPRDLPP